MSKLHTFHIPVMGTGFSIDTPIKVAHYGISSVISLVDDCLIEEMREYYCRLYGNEYVPITKYDEDFRARRITAYLNLVDVIVKRKFENVKNSPFEAGSEITKYFSMLPETSPSKIKYLEMLKTTDPELKIKLQSELRNEMRPGDINVNIMTKLDRINFDKSGNELPQEYSDALAALRGYAQSTLSSAIVFSAGINRRLYSYVEKFEDFFADASGSIKKKIILKVSDFRSSLIQGQFFAKKGLWVSEYRVESGLNCGGHAFATDGYLMGPILEEFKQKRKDLIEGIHKIYSEALKLKNRFVFTAPHEVKITAQGGIGTAKEDRFLLKEYQLDATGWATPFLLVPEVTNVDEKTLDQLSKAGEEDLYLSDVSPLGVPFNNIRGSASDSEKMQRSVKGRPGSPCPKGYLVSNTEFTKEPICTASRQYQKLKIESLEKQELTQEEFQKQYSQLIQKSCICSDLGESVRIINKIKENIIAKFPAICPGPNLAYFSKISTLAEMVDHIYGRTNLLNNTYRPHMFIKELKMYIEYLIKDVKKVATPNEKQIKYFNEFKNNLIDGMEYYKELYPRMIEESQECRQKALEELQEFRQKLESFVAQNKHIFTPPLSQLITA